jgi:hypothetical protein
VSRTKNDLFGLASSLEAKTRRQKSELARSFIPSDSQN